MVLHRLRQREMLVVSAQSSCRVMGQRVFSVQKKF